MFRSSSTILRALALGAFLSTSTCGLLVAQDDDEEEGEDAAELEAELGPDAKWLLDFKFQDLKMISPASGPGKGRVYWYMLYTLENKSGEEREFYLSITAECNRKKAYSDLFLPLVEREIERREGRRLWGQSDRVEILAQRDPEQEKYNYTTIGARQKLSCVAVFNPLDPNASKITIGVSGLSNDVEGRDEDDGSTTIREKVFLLHFERPGDEYQVTLDRFHLVGREWTRRSAKIEPSGD
jgi:hypothetical protein